MRYQLLLGAAAAALAIPAAASAQSSGSIAVDETTEAAEVVVTGTRTDNGVEGIKVPEGTKARQVLTNEFLRRTTPGNTVLDSLNIVPGVNFTQSDAYGSSGGNIRIRGFDGNRISLTFDGFPLNDTGNYAIFPNQQLDPELVQEINVNLGATDVDSPTASAAGGTINYRTIVPREELSATVAASFGDFEHRRVFGLLQTGNLTSFGTRAFVSASTNRNNKFKGPGGTYKQQYNAGLYQPLGSNGDFARISGHYNQNRNNFYRNPSISDFRTLFNVAGATPVPLAANISVANPFNLGALTEAQQEALFGFENDRFCASSTTVNGRPGSPPVNSPSCTNYFNVRVNPSNTGNVRFNSRFTLSDQFTLTVDAGYQYTLAHGGGYTTLAENSARARGSAVTSPGVDYNGDGDFSDTVGFFTPNITNTNRYTLTSSLIYNITDDHRVRVAYTYDRGNHRQTGEWGYLRNNGDPENIFSGRNGRPVLTADGFQIQQRNRRSIALLNQVSGQYVGKFFDDSFTLELGLRAPFFKRDLETFCPVEARGSGFAQCTSEPIASAFVPNTTGFFFVNQGQTFAPSGSPIPLYRPFKANYKFDAVLPNVGFVYRFRDGLQGLNMFGSYAKGFSAPRTDNLYRAPVVDVDPETTDSFDLGLRYSTRRVQAQATGWYIGYKNRIVTTFDNDPNSPNFGTSLDRNVGEVESYGADVSLTFRVADFAALTGFGSYTRAQLQSNVPLTATIFAPTAGKQVVETPKWQFGGRAQFELGPVELGVQAKWVDDRFATDVNDVVVPSYTLVDVDARFSLASLGLPRTFFQVNVRNVFDEFFFSNISTQINAGNIGGANNGQNPNFTVGYPRTVSAGFNIEF